MRTLAPLFAAACPLAAPFASAAQCGAQGKVSVTAQRDAEAASRQFADFGKWSRVELAEVGRHRFVSRGGNVELTYMPGRRSDSILLSYPADRKGRLARACP